MFQDRSHVTPQKQVPINLRWLKSYRAPSLTSGMESEPHTLWCLLLFVFLYLLPGLAPKQVFCPWPLKGGRGCSSPSLLPPTLNIHTVPASTQHQNSFNLVPPILSSLVNSTSFWIIYDLLFYFNYLCYIIFGLALKVYHPSSCQGVAIFFYLQPH